MKEKHMKCENCIFFGVICGISFCHLSKKAEYAITYCPYITSDYHISQAEKYNNTLDLDEYMLKEEREKRKTDIYENQYSCLQVGDNMYDRDTEKIYFNTIDRKILVGEIFFDGKYMYKFLDSNVYFSEKNIECILSILRSLNDTI